MQYTNTRYIFHTHNKLLTRNEIVTRIVMIKILKWILGCLAVGILGVYGFCIFLYDSKGTAVAFQSSDGNWADHEIPFKDHDFESIILNFELYKIRCNLEDVSLQRVTDKPHLFTASRWFDDYSQKKWKVPLADHHPNLKGAFYFPDFSMEHCYNSGSSKDEMATAKKKAYKLLSSL